MFTLITATLLVRMSLRSAVSVAPKRSMVTPKFPYGEACFKAVSEENRFFVDKTSFIKTLEDSGKYIQLWRPRRFGKSLVCNMLSEYYDAANSKDQMKAIFGETNIMKKNLTTKNMGKYLVLSLSFSVVCADGDVKSSFHGSINNAVHHFSEMYHGGGLLQRPVEINADDEQGTLKNLFYEVKRSGQQVYLIVDECEGFVSRLLQTVDTSQSDLGLEQYKATVHDKESVLRSWGSVLKEGIVGGTIGRAFFTGVVPFTFSKDLSDMNLVQDLTCSPQLEGLCGLTTDDVSRGLGMIPHLTADKRALYLQQMRVQYEGYRFARTQKEPLFNPQYILYFLDYLDRIRAPPDSLIDPAVCGTAERAAKFLVANYHSSVLFKLALGIAAPENEMHSTLHERIPAFSGSKALFHTCTVRESLIALAYYHGFLTYKPNQEQRAVLTSANALMQSTYLRALFVGLPKHRMQQLEATIRTAHPDMKEFARIVLLGAEEASVAYGRATGEAIRRSLAKVLWCDN